MRRAVVALVAVLFAVMPVRGGSAEQAGSLTVPRPGLAPLRILHALVDGEMTLRVLDGARERQRFTVQTDVEAARPGLADADGDGAPDLWIPVMTGNANTQYAIWRLLPAEGRFVDAGEVSGLDFRRDGGFLVATGRNGCCGVSHEFHRLGRDGRLARAFTIERRFSPRDEARPHGPLRGECGRRAGSMAPPRAIADRYCALGLGAPPPGRRLR